MHHHIPPSPRTLYVHVKPFVTVFVTIFVTSFVPVLITMLLGALLFAEPAAAQSPDQTVPQTPAATFEVNNLTDENDGTCDATHCSFREALVAANADDDFDTITFADGVSGNIQLTSTLGIGSNLLIEGPGAENLSITPVQLPPLIILIITNADPINVTIRGITFQGSRSGASTVQVNTNITATFESTAFLENHVNGRGGGLGITAGSIVTVTDSVFTNNRALQGGAIRNLGALTVLNSTFTGNRATSLATQGGAIQNEGGNVHIIASTIISSNYAVANVEGGVMVVSGTTFLNNTSSALLNIDSPLIVNGSTFTDNSASEGGAINNGGPFDDEPGGVITVNNSTFAGNSAFNGGAISNRQNGQIHIDTSTFTQNRTSGDASVFGGVILNQGAVMTITNSTLDNNRAGRGGAIANQRSGTLTISHSTISNNYAEDRFNGQCGGVMNDGVNSQGAVTLTIRNSTISGNRADNWGGGVCTITPLATTTILYSTISNNRANFDADDDERDTGGGIYNNGGNTFVGSTIIAGNFVGTGSTLDNVGFNAATPGTVPSQGFNLSDSAPTGFGNDDITNTDPLLAPLSDRGGPTFTHALFTGSPAIDAGSNGACPATDQRGVARPQDGNTDSQAVCDIGAVEMEGPLEPDEPEPPTGETLYLPSLQNGPAEGEDVP